MTAFSIIIPTYRAAPELALCLDSLRKNSSLDNEVRVYVDPRDGRADPAIVQVLEERHVSYVVNSTRLGPYGSWNRGARAAQHDLLCFLTDDQYVSPDWDGHIARYVDQYPVLTSHLVECGIAKPYQTNLIRNFGRHAQEFDEAGFLEFVRLNTEDRVAFGGFYIPTVIRKDLFWKLGGWPDKRPFPYPNDWFFRRALHKRGLEYHRVCSSFAYHFQGSSGDSTKPDTLYFERPETPPRNPSLLQRLVSKARAAPRWSLVKAGLLKPLPTKVSGYAWPKKADAKLMYQYCVGRGVEIGPGSNRWANINTIAVDLKGTFKGRVYPAPDIIGMAYDLSMFPDGSRDFVTNAHLVEHLLNPIKALREWKRVVRPGGYFYLIVPDKNRVPHWQDNQASETTLQELGDRYQHDLRETLDTNPQTSCLGNPQDATFSPNGEPGMRHFNYWTPRSFVELVKHVGLEVVEVMEAQEKDTGLDGKRWSYDDFTVVARVPVGPSRGHGNS